MIIRLTVVLLVAAIGAIALLSGCAEPQVVQATDCRFATQPCGVVYVSGTHAMSAMPITVPVSAVP